MLISIIIPIYNVETYIESCMSSIAKCKNLLNCIEIIVVNDGTKDNSMDFVIRYSSVIPNLQIISQPNQGLSVARNTGLKHANGKYVWFVDSDDSIVPESINEIICLTNKIQDDVIAFNVCRHFENTGYEDIELPINTDIPYTEYNKSFKFPERLGIFKKGLVQRYLFRRQFLCQHKLMFLPGIWYEDDQFLVRLFCFCSSIYLSSITSYKYLVRSGGSIMSTKSIKSITDSNSIINSWIAFLIENKLSFKQKQWVNANIFKYQYYILELREQFKVDCKDIYIKPGILNILSITIYYVKGYKFITTRQFIKSLILCIYPSLLNRNRENE